MRIANLDLTLGGSRTLNTSDLQYILSRSDVLCFQNGIPGQVEGWSGESNRSSGLMWREGSDASLEPLGRFLRRVQYLRVGNLLVASVDFPTGFSAGYVARSIKKRAKAHGGPVVVAGDFFNLSVRELCSFRDELGWAFYNDRGDGFFINDPSRALSFTKLAITHGSRNVYALEVNDD